MKVYRAAIIPTLLYASETWCMIQADARRLEVFQMSCLRSISGVSLRDHVLNDNIRQMCCNQSRIEVLTRENRLRWLGHVLRMNENEFCNEIWKKSRPNGWKCTRNAPKKTWDKVKVHEWRRLIKTIGQATAA